MAHTAEKSKKETQEERSVEQIIKDIRKNVAGHLAITFDDTVVLLNEYDKLQDSDDGI